MLGICLTAYADDDNKKNEPEEVSIIGTWRHDFSTGYILLVFKEKGIGYTEEYDHGGIQYSNPITYYYDNVKGRYMIVEPDGEYTYAYPVQSSISMKQHLSWWILMGNQWHINESVTNHVILGVMNDSTNILIIK